MKNNYIGKIVLLLVSIGSANFSKAQVGIGTINPNSNAVLELSSTSKGLLLSRVALTILLHLHLFLPMKKEWLYIIQL
ncbi:hypothetical protein [Chryseobacterium sp. IT-36CA2]|uniref:hypothetical protein n=1 Tax=Chryseobacterium sp. IT-36CA2 TaxID=3026460 RepID=UPI0039E028CF